MFEIEWSSLLQKLEASNLWASVLFAGAVWALRYAFVRYVNRSALFDGDGERLRWHVRTRNAALLAMLLGIGVIWASEIQTLALSLVAVAAALVVATKELIMCLSGGVMRAATRAFGVGSRIELGSVRGEVVNLGFMTTTVLETGPANQRTGRAVVFPNSLLITTPVINESYTESYLLHTFTIPWVASEGWRQAMQVLREVTEEVCEEHVAPATEHMNRLTRQHSISSVSAAPRLSVQVTKPEELAFVMRVPAPSGEKGRVEQAIIQRFLDRMYPQSEEASSSPPSQSPIA